MTKRQADKVRASRDGHEFHEAWVASQALCLLLGDQGLVGIAVEGLAVEDENVLGKDAAEVADVVMYYGDGASFDSAARVVVVQCKYSPSNPTGGFRAADCKEAVGKFAGIYKTFVASHGVAAVRKRLRFAIVTNRPASQALLSAIGALVAGEEGTGDVRRQVSQLSLASGLGPADLRRFAGCLDIQGSTAGLVELKGGLAAMITDWSASPGRIVDARLGRLRDMVRTKHGFSATPPRNVIHDTDILAALGLRDRDDLLPCPTHAALLDGVVKREQVDEAVGLVATTQNALLIEAAGGVGKTIFMKSVEQLLGKHHETLFFDCFGGGAYRTAQDPRHLPRTGLVHIANSLAGRGLCDPMLPGSDNSESLFRAFRRRLAEAVKTLGQRAPGRRLVLLLDAIDNAAGVAEERGDECFPTLLAESLAHEPIDGVSLIVSSRPERVPLRSDLYTSLPLRPFSLAETASYLRSRVENITATEVNALHARSAGNPRILDNLLAEPERQPTSPEAPSVLDVDGLISRRLQRALAKAALHGSGPKDSKAFLAGIAVLPAPVPLDEYAQLIGIAPAALESFVADLWPLLERTVHGILFRDEPTETLVRREYGGERDVLVRLANAIEQHQASSVYAARALPDLLYHLNDGQRLFALALSTVFPHAIASNVGRRNVRLARLRAAIRYAAKRGDHDQLVHLLLEMATISSGDHRGTSYVLETPDLAVVAGDADAVRRLFEARTTWQGTRHARLVIANVLAGDVGEAARHAIRTRAWINHFYAQSEQSRPRDEGPDHLDIAAVPFYLAAQGQFDEAAVFMRRWKDWFAFEVAEDLIRLLRLWEMRSGKTGAVEGLASASGSQVGVMAAMLSFANGDPKHRKRLVRALATGCRKLERPSVQEALVDRRTYTVQEGLWKASAVAIATGMSKEGRAILKPAPARTASLHAMQDNAVGQEGYRALIYVALSAALRGSEVLLHDVLPSELRAIAGNVPAQIDPGAFVAAVKKAIVVRWEKGRGNQPKPKDAISYDVKSRMESFLDHRCERVHGLVEALSRVLRARLGRATKPFRALLLAWADAQEKGGYYGIADPRSFTSELGRHLAAFALWVRPDLTEDAVAEYRKRLHASDTLTTRAKIALVEVLASRKALHPQAGEEAVTTSSSLATESDVSFKAGLYAELARAILLASPEEAAGYFRKGMDQMSAIGSGDGDFALELLQFAAVIKGPPLADPQLHILSNVCELNLPDEAEKWPWLLFGQAMTNVSGLKGLAKLSRWQDRGQAGLSCSLLPFLTAAVRRRALTPGLALALNRLTSPVELYACDTGTLTRALLDAGSSANSRLLRESIAQFQQNARDLQSDAILGSLVEAAESVLGQNDAVTRELAVARRHYETIREQQNARWSTGITGTGRLGARRRMPKGPDLKKLLARTNPLDSDSLNEAFTHFGPESASRGSPAQLLESLRKRVAFADYAAHIRSLANVATLDIYPKLKALNECKTEWGTSAEAVNEALRDAAGPLLRLHSSDMFSGRQLSTYVLSQVAELTGVKEADLALDLAFRFAGAEEDVPPAAWLALGCYSCGEASPGAGQEALGRLLESEAAALASAVADGQWREDAYPPGDEVEIAAGLIWQALGSPKASERWYAAHTVQKLAALDGTRVLDALVARSDSTSAGPFQAPELQFANLHARLWLLIALARLAIDRPEVVQPYCDALKTIAIGNGGKHVLLKHFAAQAVRGCAMAGAVLLSRDEQERLAAVNKSPFPRAHTKRPIAEWPRRTQRGSKARPEPAFILDHDFVQTEVGGLARVFGLPEEEVADRVAAVALDLDPAASSMWDRRGRDTPGRYGLRESSDDYHTHGYQLGWHALHLVAGELLAKHPITDDSYDDEPWEEWLRSFILTRQDGLWLADGMDCAPPETVKMVTSPNRKGARLPTEARRALEAAGIGLGARAAIAVAGSWRSADGVQVRVSSALARPEDTAKVIRYLTNENPAAVWLPTLEHNEDTSEEEDSSRGIPWIVATRREGGLDVGDLLGVLDATQRHALGREYLKLRPADAFGRVWLDRQGREVAWAAVWGRRSVVGEERGAVGTRLTLARSAARECVAKRHLNLLTLVQLDLSERVPGDRYETSHTYTTALLVLRASGSTSYSLITNNVRPPQRSW